MTRPRRLGMSHALNAALRSKARSCSLSLERLEDREVFDAQTVIDVNTTDDVVDSDPDTTSLREAINLANAAGGDVTINLNGGNYGIGLPDGWSSVRGDNFNEYGDFDIRLQEGGTLTINGGGATINGNALDRVFQVFGSNVTFKDLTITGGLAQDPGTDSDWQSSSNVAAGGGVLAVDSNVSFVGVTISQNYANFFDAYPYFDGGQYDGDAVGAGVAAYLSTVTLDGSTVKCNVATSDGGGYSGAALGGGLYLADGTLNVNSSTVSWNRAQGSNGEGSGEGSGSGSGLVGDAYGGGIAVEAGLEQYYDVDSVYAEFGYAYLYVDGSTISSNKAQAGDGGYDGYSDSADNGGWAFGGGVYLGSASQEGYVEGNFYSSEVSGNYAFGGSGGSISLGGYIEDSGVYRYAGSGGAAYGGGVMVDYGAAGYFDSTTLANNGAIGGDAGDVTVDGDVTTDYASPFYFVGGGSGKGGGGGEAWGGGVAVGSYGSASFSNSSALLNNYAVGGTGGDVDVDYSVTGGEAPNYNFIAGGGSNAYGGGVAGSDGSYLDFASTTISGNYANAGSAGSIYVAEVFRTSKSATAQLNLSGASGGDAYGGGVQIGSGTAVNFTGSTISGNTVQGGSGSYFNGAGSAPGDYFSSTAGGGGSAYGGGIGAGTGSGSSSGSYYPTGLFVSDSSIADNHAYGGYAGSATTYEYVDYTQYPFEGPDAIYARMYASSGGDARGGGVYVGPGDGEGGGFYASFSNTSISSNSAEGGQGGSISPTAAPTAFRYEFNGGSGGAAYGGGVMVDYDSNATFSSVTLTGDVVRGGDAGSIEFGDEEPYDAGGAKEIRAYGGSGGDAYGGGVYVGEYAYTSFELSVIQKNSAAGGVGSSIYVDDAITGASLGYFGFYGGAGGDAYGGGVSGYASYEIDVTTTTVSGNSATAGVGAGGSVAAAFFDGLNGKTFVRLASGNGGVAGGGGIDLQGAYLYFEYSTVSGNGATGGTGGNYTYDSGSLYAASEDSTILFEGGEGGNAYGGGVDLLAVEEGEVRRGVNSSAEFYTFNATISGNAVKGGDAGTAGPLEFYSHYEEYDVDGNLIYSYQDRPYAGSGFGGGVSTRSTYSYWNSLNLTYTTIAFNSAAAGSELFTTEGGWGGGIYAGGEDYPYEFGNGGGAVGGAAVNAFAAADFSGSVNDDVYLGGVIVANNTATGPYSAISNDVAAYYIDATYSLIGNADGVLGGVSPSQVLQGTTANPLDPQLLPLADNGGPTMTHALQSTSPAVDPVFPDQPEEQPPSEGFTTFLANFAALNAPFARDDQRGVLRPQDGNGDGIATNDIGAYELIYTPNDFPIYIPPVVTDDPRGPTTGALPVPPVLPPPVFIPFQTPALAVGQVQSFSYGSQQLFPNLKEVWVRLYRVEQRGGRKFSVLITAIMVNNSDTGLRAALFALRKMPPGLYQITVDLSKSELIIWEGQFPKDGDAVARRLDQVENVLRSLQSPDQFKKELIEGAQPVPPKDPSSFFQAPPAFQAPAPVVDPALSESHNVLADSGWRHRLQTSDGAERVETSPPAYADMSVVWLGDDEADADAPAERMLAE